MTVAHQVGIVHRDLKPANVLINQEGLLKIVDFGVAAAQREGDTQLTKTGYVIGSPKYMAPEQILGKKVDERADIYALGVIMYEMVTGVPPYTRGDHMSVMYQHVQGKARPPQEINPALPPGLSDLVVKAMAVDKAKRFQSMDELSTALERYLAEGRRPSRPWRGATGPKRGARLRKVMHYVKFLQTSQSSCVTSNFCGQAVDPAAPFGQNSRQ